MAEFVEVMRQAKRMCKAMGDACIGCPLHAVGECVFTEMYGENPEDWAEATVAEIERIVMDWAAAHPEPRYPTWGEWQGETFPNATFDICAREFGVMPLGGCGLTLCPQCRKQPIPADIAEKLGIKPIGGVTDENA